jgi:ankyrin repeat protein
MNDLIELHYQKDFKGLRKLIESGLKVNSRGFYNETLLHHAAELWDPEEAIALTNLLIRNGAYLNAKDISGYTPLHYLAYADGCCEVAEILIEHGAKINARSIYNDTPLDAALYKGNLELIELLRKYGAKG